MRGSSKFRTGGGGSGTGPGVIAQIFGGVPAYTSHPLDYFGVTAFGNVNDCYYVRVRAGATLNATAIKIRIGTSSGNLAVAVYADNGSGAPGARLATSGSVASPGTGTRSVALGSTLDVVTGMWLALAADNTTVTFGQTGAPGVSADAMGVGFSYIEASAFPPPLVATGVASWRLGLIMIAA